MSFSENFIKIMDEFGNKIGIAIDWTNKNVMPYMEQLSERIVNYELFTSVAWLMFAIVIFILSIVFLNKGIKHKNNPERSCYDETYIISILIGLVFMILFLIIGICEVSDIITCLTLPEKTLIEFIMKYKR